MRTMTLTLVDQVSPSLPSSGVSSLVSGTSRFGEKAELRAYVDALYAVYKDAKSVTGVVIMLGDAVVYVKPLKQKIVTRSSTESELVGISDSLSQILWTRE